GQPDPAPIYGNLRLETWWTLVPFALLVLVFGMMVRAIGEETAIAPDALGITLVGHQWWWEYRYPDGVIVANELHVPTGRQVRLSLQSADVVHNFWVPELAGKEQMIPGQENVWTFTAQKAGTYAGACSEYCGTQHGWMLLKVVADAPQDFDRWLAAQKQPPASVGSHGDALQLYATNACGGCHTIQGVSDGKAAPDLTHVGSRTTIGAGVLTNTSVNMVRWLQDPQAVKPGVLMPNFHFTQQQAQQMASFLEDLK
ncbi:MAG TPA: cytochrome c oxidase subunit II, partial [Chloroflexota bacterium]